MKGILIGVLSCCLFAPVVEHDWASISRNMNVGIYVLSLPIRDFDTVCTYSYKRNFLSYPGPSAENVVLGFEKSIDHLAFRAVKRSKRKKDVDAIITFDGMNATAVQFTAKVSDAYVNRAKVKRHKNYMVFAMNKPVHPHKVVAHIAINRKLPLHNATDYTVQVLLDSLIERYEKLDVKEKADGLITQDGTSADFIVFKK